MAKTQRTDIPAFNPGDTVRVHVKIKEGDKERLQAFEGVVIKRDHGPQASFTAVSYTHLQGITSKRLSLAGWEKMLDGRHQSNLDSTLAFVDRSAVTGGVRPGANVARGLSSPLSPHFSSCRALAIPANLRHNKCLS